MIVEDKGRTVCIYLYDNGVAIKIADSVIIWASKELNGDTYTVVDETIKSVIIDNEKDITHVVTTLITDIPSQVRVEEGTQNRIYETVYSR